MLQCESIECDWKYSFNILKKQGRFYEVNLRTVLAFRETGKGHNAMTTFNKVMNMPHPQTRRVFTKIQNITQNILDHTLALTVQMQEEKTTSQSPSNKSIFGRINWQGHVLRWMNIMIYATTKHCNWLRKSN